MKLPAVRFVRRRRDHPPVSTLTIQREDLFPSGTTVTAYAADPTLRPPSGPPIGVASGTATVSNGVLSITGLQDGRSYVLYASSPDRYLVAQAPRTVSGSVTVAPAKWSNIVDMAGLNPVGLRVRGVVLGVKLGQPTYAHYWDDGYDASFIATQIAKGIELGANCMKSVSSPGGVVAGAIAASTYYGRIADLLDRLLAAGVMVYFTGTDNLGWDGGARPTLAQEVAQLEQLGALLNGYPNVIGVDILNEVNEWQIGRGGASGDPDATSITWVQTLSAALRGVFDGPIGFSLFCGDDSVITDASPTGWNTLLAANTDFADFHPYFSSGDITEADVVAYRGNFPGRAVFFGEVSVLEAAVGSSAIPARYNAVGALSDLGYVAGCNIYSLTEATSDVPAGLYADDYTRHTAQTDAFQTGIPTRAGADRYPDPSASTATLTDSSSHGVNGTINGAQHASVVADSGFSNALAFDTGATAAAAAPSLGAAFEVELRVKRSVATGEDSVVVGVWATNVADCQWCIALDASSNSWWGAVVDGSGTPRFVGFSTGDAADTSWHTIALSWDGTTLRLLIDGSVVNTVALGSIQSVSTGFTIGDKSDGGSQYHGAADEVRVYDEAAHTSTYTPATAPYSSDSHTLRLYHCDDSLHS